MNAFRYLPFAARAIRRQGPPLHLTLFVTGACNLRCRHCFHWKEVAEGIPGPSVENIQKLADSAARMGPLLWVSFGGGEPFLRKDLPELAGAFARHGLRHLAIPTNGLVKRQEETTLALCDAAPETYVSVSVSFDGEPEAHDSIRQIEGGHAKSMAAVKRLKALKEERENLGVGILVTVTQENQTTLAAHLEELVDELRPDNVTINLARGTAMDESLLEVDLARYREVVDTKRRLIERGALPYFDFPLAKLAVARDRLMYDHVEHVASGRTDKHLPCTAGSLSAVVFEGGDVHPCEILGKPLGNLADFDWDLERLWTAAEAERLRKEIVDTRCKCTWECAQADNVLFNAKAWPKLLRETSRV
ncbi:MAG: radical SAM protein [Planctomycetota bacterium]